MTIHDWDTKKWLATGGSLIGIVAAIWLLGAGFALSGYLVAASIMVLFAFIAWVIEGDLLKRVMLGVGATLALFIVIGTTWSYLASHTASDTTASSTKSRPFFMRKHGESDDVETVAVSNSGCQKSVRTTFGDKPKLINPGGVCSIDFDWPPDVSGCLYVRTAYDNNDARHGPYGNCSDAKNKQGEKAPKDVAYAWSAGPPLPATYTLLPRHSRD